MSSKGRRPPEIARLAPGSNRPLWSVMVPTYNTTPYLRETLTSVLTQDPGPEQIQIEVVDDCSSDDPQTIIDELAPERIHLHRQPENLGQTGNLNSCIERARGHLVHILHGDDTVRNGFYRTMQQPFHDHPEIGAAFCRHLYVDPSGHERPAELLQPTSGVLGDAAHQLLTVVDIQPPAVVVKRSTYEDVGGFDGRAWVMPDLEMWMRIAASYPIWYEAGLLARYHRRRGSITERSARTAATIRGYRAELGLVLQHLEPDCRPAARVVARRRSADWAFTQARELAAAGDRRAALVQIREAFVSDWRRASARFAKLLLERARRRTLARSVSDPEAARPFRRPIAPPADQEHRPLWSVMVPTYNSTPYLRETLTSVLLQDPGPEQMQIEVVDDCSSDDPQTIIDELAPDRIHLHRQPENLGHTGNFNSCIERARGHLVHILHGDDTVRNGFYRTMQQPFHDHPEIGAAFCRHVYIGEDGSETATARLHEPVSGVFPDAAYRLVAGVGIQPPSVVVRRSSYERLGGFDSRLRVAGEDLEMWVRIAASFPVWYEIEPLAEYHRRPGSLISSSARSGAAIRDYRATIDLLLEHLEPGRRDQAYRAARDRCAGWALLQARQLAEAGDRSGALIQLREALRSRSSPQVAARAAKTAARLLLPSASA